jgi:hypothetical protein
MLALAKAEKQRSCLDPLSLVAQKLWTPEIKSGPEIVGHLTPALGKAARMRVPSIQRFSRDTWGKSDAFETMR